MLVTNIFNTYEVVFFMIYVVQVQTVLVRTFVPQYSLYMYLSLYYSDCANIMITPQKACALTVTSINASATCRDKFEQSITSSSSML